MTHAKARRREEISEKVVRAEARRRRGLALAAQRCSHSLAVADLLPAIAGICSFPFFSASPRLRVNPIFFAPSRPFGFAQDRLRVNQILPGTPHV